MSQLCRLSSTLPSSSSQLLLFSTPTFAQQFLANNENSLFFNTFLSLEGGQGQNFYNLEYLIQVLNYFCDH